MNAEEELPGGRYLAYLTTEGVDGPRVPISGERIVVQLGRDELGHALEVSILLTKHAGGSGKLVVYAIRAPLEAASKHPAYQEIVAMGPDVVPLLVRDLETPSGSWTGQRRTRPSMDMLISACPGG